MYSQKEITHFIDKKNWITQTCLFQLGSRIEWIELLAVQPKTYCLSKLLNFDAKSRRIIQYFKDQSKVHEAL